MSRKVLGLDIRSDSLCAVLVKGSLRESRIAASLTVPIEAAGDESGGLPAAIEAVKAAMDLQNADCVVSVPASLFSCRNVFVPFGNSKKIRMVLPYELEPHLPYPADEMLVDFAILDGSEDRSETELLTVAMERQRLAPVLAALAAVKIEPERVTLSGFAAAAWIGRNIEPDQTALCLDIDETSGALFVVAGSRVRLIRTFPLPPDPAARGRAIRSHIRLTMGALNEIPGSPKPPAAIFLTGSGIAGMNIEALADALPIELKPADLTRLLAVPHDDDAGTWDPLQMDGALALVLAEIEGLESLNVYRSQFPGRKIISRHRENLIRTGVLAAAVLVLMFASVLIQSSLLSSRVADLDQQIAAVFREAFPDAKKVADPYQQMQINMQELKKNAALPGEALSTLSSIDVLKNISDSIPAEIQVVLDRMVIGPEAILISGTTAGFNAVDEIKGHLERISEFKKVTISSANMDRTGKEVNFQLKVDL
ncbi:MAG: pilus assembly protein PilM [Deltaproteobacteria bacterium]|nr:pilus assembly protein PilM [Deltaproteobacteria bacterium]